MRSQNRTTPRPVAVTRALGVDEARDRDVREFLLVAGAFISGMLAMAGLAG